MALRLRPLSLALLLAGFAAQAQATDLLQAYDLARQNDPQLAASEAQRGAQGESIVQSRAALLPQLSADESISKSNGSNNGTQLFGSFPVTSDSTSDSTNRSYGITLRQSVFDASNYSRLGASKARAHQADAEYDAAANALIVRVADAYFNVLTSIETLAASRAEERSVKRQLDLAEKRLEVGLAPITDVHEARARYDSARANAIATANALDDGYEALAEITGQTMAGLKGLAADYHPENADTRSVDEWVALAMASNPTLKAFEHALAAAEKDADTARAGHYPTLSATASWRDNSNWGEQTDNLLPPPDNLTVFQNGSRGTTVGLSLVVPLFSGFATQSRLRQALFQRDGVADQLEQKKRAITRQTRGAYRSLVAGQAEVEARRQAVVSAKAAYEAGTAGLEVGTRTIVDVLIAQQQLFQAERELAVARHAFLLNWLKLRQAAGILVVDDLQAVNRALTVDADAALDNADKD